MSGKQKEFNIMKRFFYSLLALMAVTFGALAFTACGDDDGGSSSGGGGSYEEPNYKSQLMGLWSGKGTNWDDATISVSVNFDSSTNGWILLSGTGGLTLSDFYSWSASGSYISMSAEKFSSPITMSITSGSIASGNITVNIWCEKDKYCGTVQLKKDSDSGSASTSEVKLGSTSALIIRMTKSSSGTSYSSSTSTCYKTRDSSGNVYLYSNSSYTSRIGKASSNSLSTWGDYRVSSYDYLVRYNVTTSHSTYYFFN